MNLLVKAFHVGAPSRIHAVRSLLQTCANIIERLSPDYLIFAADGGHAERSRVLPTYKAHRPPKPPELSEQIELAQKAICAIGWPLIRVIDWEADDIIASLASSISTVSAGFAICSCDKDLFQLCDGSMPLKIYHPWDKGTYLGAAHVEEKYGIKRHQFLDYQALAGDSSDGIPGVKGIGGKKASELLAKYDNLESILEAARVLWIPGATGKALREQAEVARISRQLVTLHRGLKIPFTWHDYPATSPNAGWVDALRELELGAAAQRLSDVLPLTGRVRSGTSRIEVSNDQPKWCAGTIPSCGGVASTVCESRETASQTGAQDMQRSVDTLNRGAAAAGVEALDDASRVLGISTGASPRLWQAKHFVPHEDRQRDAVADALSRDYSKETWWIDFPPLAVLPAGPEAMLNLRSAYATVRTRMQRDSMTENCWQPGTGFHFVTELAMTGREFSMPSGEKAKQEKTLF